MDSIRTARSIKMRNGEDQCFSVSDALGQGDWDFA